MLRRLPFRLASLLGPLMLLAPATSWSATVRSDRPRLLLSNGTGPGTSVQVLRDRCATSDYQQRCSQIGAGGGEFPAMNYAANYVVNQNPAGCAAAYAELQTIATAGFGSPGQPDAHSYTSNNGRSMLQFAVVRDWCDPVLADGEKQWIEDTMVAAADWYLSDQVSDVFHNDMPNVWNAIGLAGLALAGTDHDVEAHGYLSAAEAQWKNVLLPAYGYSGDWWPEGFTYVQGAVGSMIWFATAWTIGTDEDLYAWADANANHLFDGYILFHAYAMRPDYHYVYFGDTGTNKNFIELFSRYLVDMLTQGTGSALGQGLSIEIGAASQPWYDYSGADGFLAAIFYDKNKDATALARETLPTARWLGRGSNDVAVLRSGWGPDDTYVWLSCGDYFSAHQHLEVGAFQIVRHAPLTVSTGCYDSFDSPHWANYYSQHSTHANVLAIYEPNELFPTLQTVSQGQPNVNDGGQRAMRMDVDGTHFNAPDLATQLAQKTDVPYKDTGEIRSFESADCHDYVACDATRAYSSPGVTMNGNVPKVSEVTRQFVFLRPSLLVVFDRVEATDPSYDKRFLLHTLTAPDIAENLVTITNGQGRLFAQTLLPAAADIAQKDDFWVGEGTGAANYPPSDTSNCEEAGGTRVEVSPQQEQQRDYFLHVLDAVDATQTTAPVSTIDDQADRVTLSIDTGSTLYTLALAKTGDLGGHLTVVDSNGSTVCDQDLGANAQGGAGGGSGGSGSGAGGSGASGQGAAGASAGDGTEDEDSGCACRLRPTRELPDGRLAIGLLLAVLRPLWRGDRGSQRRTVVSGSARRSRSARGSSRQPRGL